LVQLNNGTDIRNRHRHPDTLAAKMKKKAQAHNMPAM